MSIIKHIFSLKPLYGNLVFRHEKLVVSKQNIHKFNYAMTMLSFMSQIFDDDVFLSSRPAEPLSTNNEGTSFTVQIVLITQNTQVTEQESKKIISLGIPDNESLADAENDMEQLTQNSLKDWDD